MNDFDTDQIDSRAIVSLYVVRCANGEYFSGFDVAEGKAGYVDNPILAKKFTNKHDIKLRPEEMVVELTVNLADTAILISAPFRPHRRPRAN